MPDRLDVRRVLAAEAQSNALEREAAAKALLDAAALLAAARFITLVWVSTGNFLLGAKNDGSVWKAANPAANPLVWIQVHPAP